MHFEWEMKNMDILKSEMWSQYLYKLKIVLYVHNYLTFSMGKKVKLWLDFQDYIDFISPLLPPHVTKTISSRCWK